MQYKDVKRNAGGNASLTGVPKQSDELRKTRAKKLLKPSNSSDP